MTAGLGSGPGRRGTGRTDREDERGFTLVEMLITVAIMGVVSVGLSGALYTSIRASTVINQRTIAESELRRYAEAVRAATYVNCASTSTYPRYVAGTTTTTLPGGTPYSPGNAAVSKAVVNSVAYWTPSGASNTVSSSFSNSGSCTAPDTGLQQLNITVTIAGTPSIDLSTNVVKRRP